MRRELLHAQAAAVGLPLVEVRIPTACINELYEERMGEALAAPPLAEVGTFAFADLFLADIRAYRESGWPPPAARRSSRSGSAQAALAREFVAAGFGATLVAVDTDQIDASFAGRRFDAVLLDDLPAGIDPCGENGEFHILRRLRSDLRRTDPVEPGEIRDDGRFVYRDLLPGWSPPPGSAWPHPGGLGLSHGEPICIPNICMPPTVRSADGH